MTPLVIEGEDVATYNSLEPVEIANGKLTERGRDAVLQALGSLIVTHGLHEAIGVRLLHKHNDLTHGEIMLESEGLDSQGNWCLSTIATKKEEVAFGYSPNSWMVCNDRFVPIEFSFDRKAVEAATVMDQRFGFRDEFARMVEHLHVHDVVGPWIAPRSFYRHYPGNNAILLESSDSARRANILKYGDPGQHALKLIETSWVFRPPENRSTATDCNSHCTALCVANCTPVSACVVDPQGNHSSQSSHISSHNQLHG